MNAAPGRVDTPSSDERSVDMQHQHDSNTTPRGRRTARIALGACAVATAALVGGTLAGARDDGPPAAASRFTLSADAAERWLGGFGPVVVEHLSADAAERWVGGFGPVVVEHLSADAAERWLGARDGS
jgi:hypothetical protein